LVRGFAGGGSSIRTRRSSLDAPLRRWSDVKSLNCELVARLRMTV
jgi:hypothetical protein